MAAFFIIGEKKIRPGVYFRYENWGNPPIAGADDGRCACVFKSNWGPLGVPVLLENFTEIQRNYGNGGDNGTTDVPLEQFKGGARTVMAMRLGDPDLGTYGTYEIMDEIDFPVIKLTLAYPGSRKLAITIRPTLANPEVSELLLLEDTTLIERIFFSTPETPPTDYSMVDTLIAAAKNSVNFTLTKIDDSTEPIAVIDQEPIIQGTEPTITTQDYSNAFDVLEAYRWNVLAIDTNDTGIQEMTKLYLNRILQGGKFSIGCIGDPSTIDYDVRLSRASGVYNDFQVIYVGNGFTDIDGNTIEGYKAAARISGMIAGTPSSNSITHLAVDGAMNLTEPLSNNKHERAITAGMLTFSNSSANTVWVEKGITSLAVLGNNEDAGWKSIKRVKVRFELMQRLNDTVEVLVGRINNDPDGRMAVVKASNAVCTEMIAERKLLAGAHCEVDANNPPQGDSAWFIIYADDVEALEKLYFTFRFRFTPDLG